MNRIPAKQIEFLGKVPLFAGCSRNELRDIARLGTPVGVDDGTYLTREGKPGREFFLVMDGTAFKRSICCLGIRCRMRPPELGLYCLGTPVGAYLPQPPSAGFFG